MISSLGFSAGIDDEAPAAGRWAAVAFSRSRVQSNMDPVGRAFSEGSEYVAKDMAIRACYSSDCEIKTYVETGCIGIAKGYDNRDWRWWGFGASRYARYYGETVEAGKARARKAAGEAAKVSCESATHSQCNITEAYCTWDADNQPSPGFSVEDWIYEQGGEHSRGVGNVVQLANVVSQSYMLNLGLTYTKASCVGSRRWARASQLARQCRLSIDDLDRMYAAANQYSR